MTINISASLLKDYLLCPRMVHYRLTLPKGGIPTPDMLVGNIVHWTLEKYWKDINTALNFCLKECSDNQLEKEHIDKAVKCINSFFKNFQWLTSPQDKIEVRFKLKISEDVFLTGRMDRILENHTIVDWKTSKESPRNITYDPQFIVYYLAYKQMYGVVPSSVIYASLYDGKMVGFVSNPLLTNSMVSGIIPAVIENIRLERLPPTGLYVGKCFRCQYKEICHYELDSPKTSDRKTKT